MILEMLGSFFSQLSLSDASVVLQPLVMFVVGMVLYSVFVFKFYKFISRKEIFRLGSRDKKSGARKFAYVLEYLFLFPIIAFSWFFVISVLLSLLSEVMTIGNIFMISMAILVTIRVTSYIHEDLSVDIAKLIPYAMLGIFLLDISKLSIATPSGVLDRIFSDINVFVYYFVFLVVIELILKLLDAVANMKRKVEIKEKIIAQTSPKKAKPVEAFSS